MGQMNNENNPQVAVLDIGSISADGDVFGMYFPKKSKIVSAKLVNGAGIAQSDTDFAVVKMTDGSVDYVSHSTALTGGTGALSANVPADMSILEDDIPAGSYLKANYNESGTYAMTSAKIIVVYYPL